MALGIFVGAVCHTEITNAEHLKSLAGYFSIVTDIFLRLIKMIIAPLVFSTLVVGIANMGEHGAVGRIGIKTMAWFLGASITSLLFGMMMVSMFKPGVGLGIPLPVADAANKISASSINLKDFITHLVPKSIVEAMANNEILQIVVFSVFVGVALAKLGKQGSMLTDFAEQITRVMLLVTGMVMKVAPFAVFAAVAATVTSKGLGILLTYLAFMAEFYLSLALLWLLLAIAGYVVLGTRIKSLIVAIREPVLVAFSTASSEAAYPSTLAALEKFGVPKPIASFVLPLGYSFNLDGSMMYCTFATLFIAQAYGIVLTVGQLATMLGLLLVTSKGIASVPRASLVVIAATLPVFKIPDAGLLLILAVDQFLDMGRSGTNVVGNSIATAVVAKLEGVLGKMEAVE